MGTMTFGEQNTKDEGVEQLSYALDAGINFIDTAEIYPVPTNADTQGRTDIIVGEWLRTVDRSQVVLATKVAGRGDQMTWLPGRDGQGSRVSAKEIELSVDASLERLGTDYIDLLQIHWPDRYVPIFGKNAYDQAQEREAVSFHEQLEAIGRLVAKGKVRYCGISNETPYGVMKFCQLAEKDSSLPRIISLQNSYSLLSRSLYEGGLSEVCSPRNENVGLMAYSPLAGGILTGKYFNPKVAANSRLNLFKGYMSRYKQSLAVEAVAEYVRVARKFGLSPTELSLAWCYEQDSVASTIIGATTLDQLQENINAYDKVDAITTELKDAVDKVYQKYTDPSKI
jgi:aryl-alcohol dehydrogenase-like predicted oxidoreductase